MTGLPKRTLDTMSMAIAMSSPSGRISKAASRRAGKRLSLALFGPDGLPYPSCDQPSNQEQDMRRAKEFRSLAKRGMNTRKYNKAADAIEAKYTQA